MPRFDQSFNGLCEQNLQDTLQLKQRYLDAKTKRAPKTKDKKQQDSIQSSVHVQQKFLKRSAEEHDPGGGNDGYEPPVKLQCTTQHGGHQPEGLTKFSVEIVQQLEFTTSAANSQPQQISTNVTVKAHTNASVKSDVASPKSNPSTPAKSNIVSGVDVGTLVECVKQEPDNDFADLDQCAAALEKDAVANGGTGFGGLTDLIGDDTNDEIITSDALKDLISDITNCPGFMTDFDFDDKTDVVNDLKVEDLKDLSQLADGTKTHSPLLQGQNYSPPVFENKNRMPYPNMDFGKTELSPAAQTLKQMAEQHQHKNQMGLSYNPNNRAPNSRSPYQDFQLGDYGSPNSNSSFHKNSPNFPQPDMIKQEMMFQGSDFDMKRKGTGMYKQQYSPYGSPSASSHGSPGYLPRGSASTNNGPNTNAFGAGTPPRPPSGPGGNNSVTTLQINQAQQLHISQQSHGHNIQVSAGQHLHLSGDLKGNVSIATQQGMHFSQQHANSSNNASQQQNSHQTSQSNAQQQQNPLSSQNNSQQHSGPGPGQQQNTNQHPSSMLSGNQHPNLQSSLGGMGGNGIPSSMTSNMQSPGIGTSMHSPGISSSGGMPGSGITGTGGMPGNITGGGGMPGSNGMPGSGLMGPGTMGSSGIPGSHHGGIPGSQHISGQTSLGDTYSLSQSQTINFTQQTLRQRANGVNGMPPTMGPNGPMGPAGPMGGGGLTPRHMSPQVLEQQKLIQQQQMLRAQQAAMQQHIRPPPPDYKASAGMMQGMQPRYSGAPPSMRRMPHQPMPPSGPMMRPHNMYMMQQQHMATRGMYPRQQTAISSMDAMPQHGSTEWRHMIMQQQQSANFNAQMRPSFQQGFNMNSGGMQMTALQHQQLRQQQSIVGGTMGPGQGMSQGLSQGQVMGQTGPMAQMNSMNQQMISHMQQQQTVMQQNANQMSISNIHMQQTQSMSISSQSMQQQQQQNMNNQLVNASSANSQPNAMSSFNAQAADFSLEFLDNLSSADTGFTEQELLSSFDSDSGFNLQDIL